MEYRKAVLHLLIFMLHVNEIPRIVESPMVLYAEDVKISGDTDACVLQTNLNIVISWSKKWLIHFNKPKCALIK